MNQPKIRVGVVGLGFGQNVCIPGFQVCPDTEVVAVCSRSQEKADQVAGEFEVPHAFADYDAMLHWGEFDVVNITTPPYLHRQMSVAAIEAGKHVLCEKPMALDVTQAQEMVQRAQAAGVVGMIDHEYHFLPTWAYVKELIGEGYLGQLYTVNLTAFASAWAQPDRPPAWADPDQSPWNWLAQKEKGGGILGALGSHLIDALHWWFGEIESVLGQVSTFVPERKHLPSGEMRPATANDSFAIFTRLTGGAEAIVRASFVVWGGSGMRLEAYGSQGTLILENMLHPGGKLWGAQRGQSAVQELTVPNQFLPERKYADRRLAPFVGLVEKMVEGIRKGQAVSPSFHDGLKVQQVMDAAIRSDQEGRWIDLGEL